MNQPTEADAANRNPTPVTTVTIPYIKGTSETIPWGCSPQTYNYVTTLTDQC